MPRTQCLMIVRGLPKRHYRLSVTVTVNSPQLLVRGSTRKVSNIKWRYQECFGAVAQPFGLMPTRCRISVDADERDGKQVSTEICCCKSSTLAHQGAIGFSALTRAAEWDDMGAFQEPIEEMGITLDWASLAATITVSDTTSASSSCR